MVEFILELGLIVGIAAIVAMIGRLIKQPPIIAYLITGILVGPLAFNVLHATEFVEVLAHLGVAFLLFIVGLSLDFKVLKEVGGISLAAGTGAILTVSGISFVIALLFGIAYKPALYLAVALAFSSTVVVVKLLSDKKEIDTLHGRIALGILIVEDFVAALVLMVVPVLGTGDFSIVLLELGKALLLIAAVFAFAYLALPKILSIAARNQEVLFLSSVAWALLIATLFSYFGFSLEIGALLAGIAIAQSKYALDISGKIKNLRDFFVVLFFVYFGSRLAGPLSASIIVEALVFSGFILVGKPIIVMTFMRLFGYKKRTNFFAGVGLAQISEFSLILLLLGFNIGTVPQSLLTLGILIALITIALSSYSIYYSHYIFNFFSPFLGIFEGKKNSLKNQKGDEYDVILLGYHRAGYALLKAFEKANKRYLVVDYNPKTILSLIKDKKDCVYGDANDRELLEELPFAKTKVVISTIPDFRTNIAVMNHLNKTKTLFIPTSRNFDETVNYYEDGVDYVIRPNFFAGEYVAGVLQRNNFDRKKMRAEGMKQKKEIKERIKDGETPPK